MKNFRIVSIGLTIALFAALVFALTDVESAVFAAPAQQGAIIDVRTPGLSFSPPTVRIKVGDTVRWTMDREHDAESDTQVNGAPLFKFPLVESNSARYTFTFTEAGTYTYRCNPHLAVGMVGTIIVESDSPTPAPCTNCTPRMYLPFMAKR